MKDAGEFYAALQSVAVYTGAEISTLLAKGYERDEAKELMRPPHILLEPQPQGQGNYRPDRFHYVYRSACAASTECQPAHG